MCCKKCSKQEEHKCHVPDEKGFAHYVENHSFALMCCENCPEMKNCYENMPEDIFVMSGQNSEWAERAKETAGLNDEQIIEILKNAHSQTYSDIPTYSPPKRTLENDEAVDTPPPSKRLKQAEFKLISPIESFSDEEIQRIQSEPIKTEDKKTITAEEMQGKLAKFTLLTPKENKNGKEKTDNTQ